MAEDEELYKKVTRILNKFEMLVSYVRELQIDTEEKLQGVVDLVFEKAVSDPNFTAAGALMCRELALTQVHVTSSTEEKEVQFQTLLITRCRLEFGKQSRDETIRNDKIRELTECIDVEKKRELEFDLEEYERKLRIKYAGVIRFLGELFNRQVLRTSFMMRCLYSLSDNKDEESLEYLCTLLKTIGKELERGGGAGADKKSVDLSPIFHVMNNIVKHDNICKKVRFMLQELIDLRNNKWIPLHQDLNLKTEQKEAENEQYRLQTLNSTHFQKENQSSSTSTTSSASSDGIRGNISDHGRYAFYAPVSQQQPNQPGRQAQSMAPTGLPNQSSTPPNNDLKVQSRPQQQSMNNMYVPPGPYFGSGPLRQPTWMPNQQWVQQQIFQATPFMQMYPTNTMPHHIGQRAQAAFGQPAAPFYQGQPIQSQFAFQPSPSQTPSVPFPFYSMKQNHPPQSTNVLPNAATLPVSHENNSQSSRKTSKVDLSIQSSDLKLHEDVIALEASDDSGEHEGKDSKDEETLERLCKLLTTISKDIERGEGTSKKSVDLSPIFNAMTNIVDTQHEEKNSSRVKFMLQDVIDLWKNKWVPKATDQEQKETKNEQFNKQSLNSKLLTSEKDTQDNSASAATKTKTKIDITEIVKTETQDEAASLNNDELVQAQTGANAKASSEKEIVENKSELPYREDHCAPNNLVGKKVYDKEFLLALRNDPASRRKPDNLPDNIIADDQGRRSCSFFTIVNSSFKKGPPPKRNKQLDKVSNSRAKSNKPDVEVSCSNQEFENASSSATLNRQEIQSFISEISELPIDTEELKTKELSKKVRKVLNKLNPQNFDTVVSQIRQLPIDTEERLQVVVDLVFEKAITKPIFSALYALMCRKLALMQVPANSTEEKKEVVQIRELLIKKCRLEFEKHSFDKTIRNDKVKEIGDCNDPERKNELQFELNKYDIRIQRKSMGNFQFMGELYKQQMLSTSIIMQCFDNLLNDKDEDSLECLCKLLTTLGKEIERVGVGSSKKGVDLSSIFNFMKDIVNKDHTNICNRVKFMLQDVIDLRKNKWVPLHQNLIPQGMDQIQKKAENEQLYIQALNLIPMTRKDDRGNNVASTISDQKRRNVSDIGSYSRNKTPFTVQSDKLKNKPPESDEPLGSKQMFDNWSKGSDGFCLCDNLADGGTATKAAVTQIPVVCSMTEEQLERHVKNNLDEYLNDSCTIDEYSQDTQATVPPTYLPRMVADGYLHVLERSTTARIRTGILFAKLIKMGTLPLDDYCVGLEEVLSQVDELTIDIPMIWNYLAEILVHLICEEALPLNRLYKSCELIISQGHGSKTLGALFKLVVSEKGPNFLINCWQTSGLSIDNFMEPAQVDSFLRDNKLDFLCGGDRAAGQSQLTYEQIYNKLLEFFSMKTSFDDIVSWITVHVGEIVKENKFVRTLVTTIFENSVIREKLVVENLKAHYKLLQKYVDNNPNYELQCLYALQALIHKLEYPKGLLLTICKQLYEDGIILQDSFIAWEASDDLAEQASKGFALKELTSFLTQLKENSDET